jgi:hypothetical protein
MHLFPLSNCTCTVRGRLGYYRATSTIMMIFHCMCAYYTAQNDVVDVPKCSPFFHVTHTVRRTPPTNARLTRKDGDSRGKLVNLCSDSLCSAGDLEYLGYRQYVLPGRRGLFLPTTPYLSIQLLELASACLSTASRQQSEFSCGACTYGGAAYYLRSIMMFVLYFQFISSSSIFAERRSRALQFY